MLFRKEFHGGLRDGSITLTFRTWSKPQVTVGGRYRIHPIGLLEVDAVDEVRLREITAQDATASGFESRDALLAVLRKTAKKRLIATSKVTRVAFHYAGGKTPPPSLGLDTTLSDDDVAALSARLETMDRRSKHGPWTDETLDVIRRRPQVAASKLAPELGRERKPFKADVRKLKKLGLTLSFEVGYEISPRGEVFLRKRKTT